MTTQQPTDIPWFYLRREARRLLVSDREWSWGDAETRPGEPALAALLDTPG